MTSRSGLGFSSKYGGRRWIRTSRAISSASQGHSPDHAKPAWHAPRGRECLGERVRTGFWIGRGGCRLAGIVQQPCEQKLQLGATVQQGPFLGLLQFGADHPGVSPHIALRVPLRVLQAGRHVARPRLRFRPSQNLGGVASCMALHVFISKCRRLWSAGSAPTSCAASARSASPSLQSSMRTNFARPVTVPFASVRR